MPALAQNGGVLGILSETLGRKTERQVWMSPLVGVSKPAMKFGTLIEVEERIVKRVTGLGGVFFKADDPEALYRWYEEHLGIQRDDSSGVMFAWRKSEDPSQTGFTVWSIFKRDTKYFEPSQQPFMLNYRVDKLDEVLAALRAEGVAVEDRIEECDYGRFGWLTDPEGNRIELWEPPATKQS